MKSLYLLLLTLLLAIPSLAQTSIKGRVCNIRDFGAIGNDSTDNTTAISSAITVCQTAGGGTIWIPAGVYRTQPITQNIQGVTFQGDSGLTAILKPVNVNEPIFNVTGAGYSLYVTIQNIGLTGRGKTSGSSGHCAVFGSLTPNQEAAYFTIRNVYIKECGGKGLYMPGQFTTLIEAVDTDEIGDNHIEIQGGNTTTLVRNYVHTVEAGKVGYRIHGGDVTLIGNNGVDPDSSVTSLWGIFGDQTSLDGSDSYFRGTLIGNNIEDIGDQGLDFREGSYGTFSGNAFTTKSSGNHIVARFRYVDASDAQGVWNGNNRVILTGGAYTSGAAIHSQGTPFTQVGNASFTQYYDTSLATLITLPTVTSGLVSGSSNSALKLSRAQITALESSGLVGILTGASDYTGATSKIRLQDGTASLPVFGNTSSSTTGMYFPSGTGVGFTVGGSQKLSLGSSVHQFTGDVGFGASPSYPIDVVANGGAIAQQWRETGAGTTRVQLQIPASYGQIGTSTNHAFALITNGNQRVNVESTGGTVFGSIVPATSTVMINAIANTDVAFVARNASGAVTDIAKFEVAGSQRFGFNSNGTATFGLAATASGKLVFANSSNSNLLTLQPGATGSALTFTLPTADGSSGQCMQTNGSGVLSFASCGGSPTLTSTYIGYGNGSNVLTGSANHTWDETNKIETLTSGSTAFIRLAAGSTASGVAVGYGLSGTGAIHPGSGGGLLLPLVGGSQSSGPGIWWTNNNYNATAGLWISNGLNWQGHSTSGSPFKVRTGTGTSSDGTVRFTLAPDSSLFTQNASTAQTAANVDVEVVDMVTSGTAAANLGIGRLYTLENASGSQVNASRIGTRWAVATAGSETSTFFIANNNSGSGLADSFTIQADQYHGTYFADNITGGATIDFNNGNVQELTFTGNVTSTTLSNLKEGGIYFIIFKQSSGGGNTLASTNIKVTGGSLALTATANARDLFQCAAIGSNLYCSKALDVK